MQTRVPMNWTFFLERIMLVGKTQPLEMAQRVLQASTLQLIAKSPYTIYGWKIVDRWAVNDPQKLSALEAQGEILLLSRLLEQQTTEMDVLTTQAALERLAAGETEFEILASAQVQTEL
ncbi:hypothetical protein [Cupriavidus sp. D39]|uniref:hypothetical protein n=1 Tax=Cupriavidus sp. D39 TaxID=2997877 RepID=UPI002271DC19|nr:hypothetical protein [Cupriavidus sp. D39]MCY0853059.1 hypothetical protein [Cupriavidus sp. D39]